MYMPSSKQTVTLLHNCSTNFHLLQYQIIVWQICVALIQPLFVAETVVSIYLSCTYVAFMVHNKQWSLICFIDRNAAHNYNHLLRIIVQRDYICNCTFYRFHFKDKHHYSCCCSISAGNGTDTGGSSAAGTSPTCLQQAIGKMGQNSKKENR